MMESMLFTPLTLRTLKLKNRIIVSPMCQYSAENGVANDWHMVHIGSRTIGGAGMIIMEATGVSAVGRITPHCLGLWNETQCKALQPIVRFMKAHGTAPAIQLAHAGRKASVDVPWRGGQTLLPSQGGWVPLAPSALPFKEDSPVPHALKLEDLNEVTSQFVHSAKLARQAGFEALELHMAHGYLMHQFLSPLSNLRTDEFGGSLENRMRFPLQITAAVRKVWPDELPLLVRISATDWAPGGWDENQSVILTKELQKRGVDFIDVSTGGNVAQVKIPVEPGYQVPFAAKIKKETGILTGAVGLISEAKQAEEILTQGKADAVILARALLRDPYWPLHAAQKLGVDFPPPPQYERSR